MLNGRSIGNQSLQIRSLLGLELIGMLKEATLEKRAHAPLKITLVRTPGANSTSKHQNVIQVSIFSWSYSEEQTRMGFLVLHEVDVYEMDIHPVSNGRHICINRVLNP